MSIEWLTISNSGLILDFVGAALLYFYGFPTEIDLGGFDQKAEPAKTKSHFLAKLGFLLLMLGFVLQFVGSVR